MLVYDNNILSEKEVTFNFHLSQHRNNKILKNKFNQEGEKLLLGNSKIWQKKLKTTQTNGKTYYAHGLEELISLRCPYYPKPCTDSMQSLSKYQ